ncbi:hypothetical protein AGMMS50293_00230 [Spirochaetia bacterium]|nr:hypothetical protein AGMMS50293_00230 [Spirochaetia bacterium]
MKDAIKMMESKMSARAALRARQEAERETLTVRLSQLRERLGKKQGELEDFSQTSISRLEKRKDIRVSTLIEYLGNLGMGLEIRTYPRMKNKKVGDEILLKV